MLPLLLPLVDFELFVGAHESPHAMDYIAVHRIGSHHQPPLNVIIFVEREEKEKKIEEKYVRVIEMLGLKCYAYNEQNNQLSLSRRGIDDVQCVDQEMF